jgi:Flp pilus assembly protein TadB
MVLKIASTAPAPLVEQHFFLYEIALHIQRRHGGNLKEIMKTRWSIEISDDQATRIRHRFKGE